MQCEFQPEVNEIVAARRFAENAVRLGHARLADVLVVVSELASNAVRHAGTGFTLSVDEDPEHVRIEVTDRGDGWPTIVETGAVPTDGGMGLHLVNALADRWGAMEHPAGKMVWAELDGAVASLALRSVR